METHGYKIQECIATTRHSEIFLATHPDEPSGVICKNIKSAFVSSLDNDHLQNEFELLTQFDHPAIIKSHGIHNVQGKNLLVRDYFDGLPLSDFLKAIQKYDQQTIQSPETEALHAAVLNSSPVSFDRFLSIAIQIVEAIEAIHEQDVVHGNLSSSCILIDPSSDKIMLTGFGYAARRMKESVSEEGLKPSELASFYSAPEQSDRIDGEIGHAADIYSLGIIFFQMLSGRLPFVSDDAIGLMHDHIAKTAPRLTDVVADMPAALSGLVAKMLAKMPVDRYSSATSLKVDLIRCLDALRETGEIAEFKPDLLGSMAQFNSAGKLYGRETVIADLTASVQRQFENPQASMNTLYGASGVGKSSLVEAALKDLEGSPGFRLMAKFDQYRQNTPFEMLYGALRDLIGQIVAGEEDALRVWKRRLQTALGNQAGVLTEAIPEVEWIIGPQAAVETLPPSDAKIRLNSILCRFIQAFASLEHPFFLILDDMQWADSATLEWLETALQDVSNLAVIALYRDNEVGEDHPFYVLLQKARDFGALREEFELSDLSKEAVNDLISDCMPSKSSDRISEIIFQKTGGNAFFVTEYLKQLHKDGVVCFDHSESCWTCDLERLQHLPVSDNVVEFLSQRMVAFPERVKSLLKIASCIGNRFSDRVAQAVYADNERFDFALQTALNEGWIRREATGLASASSYYVFSHDRIQQAVWSMLEADEKARIHHAIGRFLLAAQAQPEKEVLLECVNHLNEASVLIDDEREWQDLAELNFKASQEAKSSGDFELALDYIQRAMDAMPSFEEQPLAAIMYRNRAECEHLCNRRDQAIHFYNQAVSADSDLLEKGQVFELMIKFYTDISEFEQAYAIGRSAVKMFGVNIPSKFNPALFAKDFIHLQAKLRKYEIAELLDLPAVEDERIQMVIRLLSAILKAAYQIKPELCVAISLKVIALCLKHGNTREAVVGYIVFGIIFQGGVLGKHKIGYEYGQLSMALVERYGNVLQKAEVQFVFGYFAMSWQKASAVTEQHWFDAYRHGLEVGDWFHTGCAAAGIIQSMFMRGKPLDEIEEEIEQFQASLQRIGAEEHLGTVLGVKQAIRNLRGETYSKVSFDHAEFDEDEYVASLERFGSRHFAHYYYVNKMLALYLHKEYQAALDVAQKSRSFLADSKGMLHAAEHHFLNALIQAKLYDQAPPMKRQQYRLNFYKTINRFTAWTDSCPENFLARLRIMEGERYRLSGDYPQALRCFDSAIETAGVFGQPNLQAIANSLAADVYELMNQSKAVALYRQEANVCFRRWGASIDIEGASDKIGAGRSHFDVSALMKATEVIAREKRLPELLETLIGIMIENAGAQHGLLLLQDSGRLWVQAEASVEFDTVQVMQRVPYVENPRIVHSIVNYVQRTEEAIVLNDARQSAIFGRDEMVVRRGIKAVLCAPLTLHGQFKGVIYLENNEVAGVFTKDRIELLQHLSGHIAIAIDNALIYDQLEQKVAERTRDVDIKNEALESQNVELKQQNDKILELNSLVVKENEERKKVEVQLQQAIEELNRLASTDGLTGLHNRRNLDQYLQQECARLSRSEKPLALLLCDIDFFKAYNDYYGHQQGDVCLKHVADLLESSVLRTTDFVARYGGEEFVIVMPGTTEEAALMIAEDIHVQLQKACIPHDRTDVADCVTVSIGLGVAPAGQHCSPESLLKITDEALYLAKQRGRNRTVSARM
ncbi:diguanylate cyclase [Thiomicrorhabdus sp.]|uniref:diguanylate cyclase n=1 Tax=Thiomicrorhabdus sp. TaxID=2039724 RepID=UPI0035685DAF